MENQVKTSTENKEQQLKKLSKMTMIRSLLPIAGLIIIFLMVPASHLCVLCFLLLFHQVF